MDKAGGGQYRLYNEFSRASLGDSGNSNNNITSMGGNPPSNSDLWQFAKNGDDLWLRCQDISKWLAISNNRLCLMDPGD